MAETRSQELIGSLLEGSIKLRNVISDLIMKKGIRRTRLYMRQDSVFLNRIAEDSILAAWLQNLGIEKEQLSDEEMIDMRFIISGPGSIVGSDFFDTNINAVARISYKTHRKSYC